MILLDNRSSASSKELIEVLREILKSLSYVNYVNQRYNEIRGSLNFRRSKRATEKLVSLTGFTRCKTFQKRGRTLQINRETGDMKVFVI